MIKVLFFANFREQLGCGELDVAWSPDVGTVTGLRQRLVAQGGATWRPVLDADNVIKAVNQVVVEDDAAVADGDEVAFFPPVTGG
jgi:molybdopterin synthase sulfur carrier subunit